MRESAIANYLLLADSYTCVVVLHSLTKSVVLSVGVYSRRPTVLKSIVPGPLREMSNQVDHSRTFKVFLDTN